MHYTPHVDLAFASVEHIMRDVNNGWLLRYLHANGASMFFIAVYVHMAKNLYYGSYTHPENTYGVLGYYLPSYDGYWFYWICSTLGTNEFLGSNCDYQFSFSYPFCRPSYC